jgi:hypothetical protein
VPDAKLSTARYPSVPPSVGDDLRRQHRAPKLIVAKRYDARPGRPMLNFQAQGACSSRSLYRNGPFSWAWAVS